MTPSSCYPKREQETVLTADQQHVCAQLLSLALVRASTTETALPVGVLRRWSVPLLVGPAGSGKAYVCEEVALRWGKRLCRRWEVGSWITNSNRISQTTLEQIRAFVSGNPTGCVVYLAGMDLLGVKAEHNASYAVAVAGEITQLLDDASARPARFTGPYGNAIQANVLVVVGGCFAAMWGDAAIDGPSGGEAWRLADGDPLAGPHAITKWLLEHSRLPADILRRLSPEPLILHRLDREQAQRLAVRLCDNLPPSLDGLRAEEFRDALQSPHGWRAVAALIERAWVDGHDTLFVPQTEATVPTNLQLFSKRLKGQRELAVLEPGLGVLGSDRGQAGGDGHLQGCLRARPGLAQERLELGEGMFDGIEVRTVGGQKHQAAARRCDAGAHRLVPVRGQVVQDHGLAGPQHRAEHLVQIAKQLGRVGAALQGAGGDQPRGAHRCQDRSVAPAVARDFSVAACSLGRVAVARAQGAVGSALVQEDQARWLQRQGRLPAPGSALQRVLLAGGEGLFFRVQPRARTARQRVGTLTWMPSVRARCSQRAESSRSGAAWRCSRNASTCSGRRSLRGRPPPWRGVRLSPAW